MCAAGGLRFAGQRASAADARVGGVQLADHLHDQVVQLLVIGDIASNVS